MPVGIEVTLDLRWTYGLPGPAGRTRYVGPGRVTLSLDEALAIGGDMATAIYRYEGKKYTAETLGDAPEAFIRELRRRGVKLPDGLQADDASPTDATVALTDIDGVGEEMAAALMAAGFSSVADVAAATAEALVERVAGIGPKSAPAIIAAAGKAKSG